MVRSAAVVLAFLILPGFAQAQQAATHTVVDGDTLWDLAASYLGDPFDWRRIWNANRAQIDDPNLILPGQVLTIPDTEAPAESTPTPAPQAARPAPDPAPTPPVDGRNVRTIFFPDTAVVRAGVIRGEAVEHLAVPRDLVYSAPRLTGFVGDPRNIGRVDGAASGRTRNVTLRSYQRIHITTNEPVRVGDDLQIFTVTKTIEDVGRVVMPTGVASVVELVDGGAVAVITREYGRIVPGQLIGPLPRFTLEAGTYAQEINSGDAAMVVGTANTATLQDLGHVVFLDVGTRQGVAIGDEFTFYNQVDTDDAEGVVQVVGVQDDRAAARILNIEQPVFEQGVVLRLTKKMR